MINYFDLRKKNYEDRRIRNNSFEFDILDWKGNPYSCFKARIYIELSSILAFIFQFTFLTANHVSLMYGASGIIAGLLLITNIDSLMISGLVIFFLKGTLDWTDGLIARIKNETSPIGHILDTWGSHIGDISLITSIGIYCYNFTDNNIYLYVTILILFLKAIDFKLYSFHQLFYELLNQEVKFELKNDKDENLIKKKDNLLVIFVKNFMDNRARTTDPVCLLIFLEIVYNLNYFSKIIFWLYFLKAFMLFFGVFYVYYFRDKLKKNIK